MTIDAVFFDVGEVLVDETREYGTWADWLGIPRHTFSAVFGAIVAEGGDYRETFQVFQPGFDLGRSDPRGVQQSWSIASLGYRSTTSKAARSIAPTASATFFLLSCRVAIPGGQTR